MYRFRCSRVAFAAALALVTTASWPPAYGQPQAEPSEGASQQGGSDQSQPPRASSQGVPPQLERDFGFPDPDRPWGRGRYLDRAPYRPRGYFRRFGGARRYYYDDYTYRFGVPGYGDPLSDDLERAYRQGVEDGRNYERFEMDAWRGLSAYQDAMAAGYAAFAAGEFGPAARYFLQAAALNQGGPAARICAAQAQFALGHYEAAVRLLRRAFGLQPKLVYLPIDLRSAYGDRTLFNEHLDVLRRAVERDMGNADLWLLLGYCCYYSDDATGAAEALATAAKLRPGDKLITQLAELARMSVPDPERDRGKREAQPALDER